jgi:hypothetical protein
VSKDLFVFRGGVVDVDDDVEALVFCEGSPKNETKQQKGENGQNCVAWFWTSLDMSLDQGPHFESGYGPASTGRALTKSDFANSVDSKRNMAKKVRERKE